MVTACLAAIVLGAWIGTGIGHRRAERRANRAAAVAAARAEAEGRQQQREERRERSSENREDAVENANAALLRAAQGGQRAAVRRAEAQLAAAGRRSDAADRDRSERPKDPYTREIEGFPIKQPPLVAQQITSSEDDRVLFAGVFRPYFCVKTPSERAQAGRAVYRPIARRLRRAGVHDFELVVTPVTKRAPERRDALAVGAAGSVELTRAGRRC